MVVVALSILTREQWNIVIRKNYSAVTRTTVWRLDVGHTEIFSEMNDDSINEAYVLQSAL